MDGWRSGDGEVLMEWERQMVCLSLPRSSMLLGFSSATMLAILACSSVLIGTVEIYIFFYFFTHLRVSSFLSFFYFIFLCSFFFVCFVVSFFFYPFLFSFLSVFFYVLFSPSVHFMRSSICLFDQPSIFPSIHPSSHHSHPSAIHLFLCSSQPSSIRPSIHLSIFLFLHPSIHPSIHTPTIYPSVHPFDYIAIHPFIHPSIC